LYSSFKKALTVIEGIAVNLKILGEYNKGSIDMNNEE
jgi:hypothetical protein